MSPFFGALYGGHDEAPADPNVKAIRDLQEQLLKLNMPISEEEIRLHLESKLPNVSALSHIIERELKAAKAPKVTDYDGMDEFEAVGHFLKTSYEWMVASMTPSEGAVETLAPIPEESSILEDKMPPVEAAEENHDLKEEDQREPEETVDREQDQEEEKSEDAPTPIDETPISSSVSFEDAATISTASTKGHTKKRVSFKLFRRNRNVTPVMVHPPPFTSKVQALAI